MAAASPLPRQRPAPADAPKRVVVLGATGSIGRSTLDVIARHPGRFEVIGLSAATRIDDLVELCARHRPRYAAIADAGGRDRLAAALKERGLDCEPLAGGPALDALASASDVDCVMAAIVGAAGLSSTLAAARAGKQILLANKEAIVMAGALLVDALAAGGGVLLPVDSEHNAVFQCLPEGYAGDAERHGIERIVLTASGGPFRGRSRAELAAVTPDQACAHPKWSMGRKISVDSATLMNKGLETIEAHWLFGLAPERIDVVVHPQSLVHALVAYRDGAMLAELGVPDMRTAIAHALAWPERVGNGVPMLDLVRHGRLDFEAADHDVFRCLPLAYAALATGGSASVVLNAANEVAVAAFLDGRIGFLDIADVVADCLDQRPMRALADIDIVMNEDAAAREAAERRVTRMQN